MDNEKILEELKKVTACDTFFVENGMELLDAGYGYCRTKMTIEKKHLNPIGTIHGGCLYTLADTTCGNAASTTGKPGPTLSGDMYFEKSAALGQTLYCEAKVVKSGFHVNIVESQITNEKGDEIARATMQFMILSGGEEKEKGFSFSVFSEDEQ